MRCAPTALAAAVLLPLMAPSLGAQVVRGRLVGSGTERPVPGALVGLVDTTGNRVAVELADVYGRFVLTTPQAGIYRLEVRRVGYQTAVSPALHLFEGDTLHYTMEIAAETIQLPAVIVREEKQCNLLPDAGRETAATWEEARKALDIAAWTEARGALRFHTLRWDRKLDPDDLAIRSESQEASVSVARQPFRSLPADELASGGYVRTDGNELTYYAPDAEVLLSETFLADHCFRLEAGEERQEGMVGLAFEPVSGRDLPDVAGVLWLERATAELRYMEYEYANLEWDVPPRTAGGYVGFERLRTGAWIVRHWWIRMPELQIERRRLQRGPAGTEIVERLTVVSVVEQGGEVTATFNAGGEQLDAELTTTLLGTVFDSTRARPLARATVRLVGTDFVTRTDRRGAFRIHDVPEGDYVVQFEHPRFEAWGLPLPTEAVPLVEGFVTSVDLAVPSVTTVSTTLCPDHPFQERDGLVVGFVTDSTTGVRLPEATVVFEWIQPGAGPDTPRGHIEVITDTRGSFRACGLPPDVALTVWGRVGERWTEAVIVRVGQGAIVQHDVKVDMR